MHLIAAIDLWAYADESGIHGDALWCIIAGYIASPRQWSLFRKEWRVHLEKRQLSSFHSRKFNWDSPGAKEFVMTLATTINNHRLYPIGVAIAVKAFNALTLGERKFLTGGNWNQRTDRFETHGKPSESYFVTFLEFIHQALKRVPEDAHLHLVFDRQNIMESRAKETYEELVASGAMIGSHKLSDISYHIDPPEPALQAADLYAHEWYGFLVNNRKTDVMNILTKKERGMYYVDATVLEKNLTLKLPPSERTKIQALK